MYFLKYRPQTIDELDLASVRQNLKKIVKQKDLPHAFLFAGPKGLGKTSAARILAKTLNCSETKKEKPCNKCSICKEITKGTSLDVVEIDAASNRGIDDIRQLREKIGLAPIKAKYKVYIIDEVHMLTKQAFNALLKTIEEPPEHVIFIFCTTDPEEILPTVLSRLLRIDFQKANSEEIKRSLEKVTRGEKLTVDEEVLKTIIELSDGGFRDAQKILESLALSLGNKIIWKKAKESLLRWQKQKPTKLLELLGKNEDKEVFEAIEELASNGVDFSDYLSRLLNLVQELILANFGVTKLEKQKSPLTKLFSRQELADLAKLLSQAYQEQKKTPLPQLPLQLALVDFLSLIAKIRGGDQGKSHASRVDETNQSLNDPTERELKSREALGESSQKGDSKEEFPCENFAKNGKDVKDTDLETIESNWQKLIQAVKPMNHSVSAFLRAARPKEVNQDGYLVLEVFYPFHKDKLEEDRNRKIVEAGLGEIGFSSLRLRCVLAERIPQPRTREVLKEVELPSKSNGNGKDSDLYQVAKEIFGS